MSALAIVIAKLNADSAVKAVVGAKIRPIMFARDDRPPCIVVNVIATSDEPTLSGPGKYYRNRVRVECLAETATQVTDLGELVIDVLNGVIKEQVAGCKDVDILIGSTDMSDYADDQSVFRRFIDFYVRWRRA